MTTVTGATSWNLVNLPANTPVWNSVLDRTVLRANVPKTIYGFNVVWRDFMLAWAPDGAVDQRIRDLLIPFAGALYRYPGGTPSNWFEWRKAVGTPRGSLPLYTGGQKSVVNFGVDEFFTFVRQVGGHVIYTLNMVGPDQSPQLVSWALKEAQDLIQHIRDAGNIDLVECFELGNELDPAWSVSKYAYRAGVMLTTLKQQNPDLKFIIQSVTSPLDAITDANADRFMFDTMLSPSSANTLADGVASHIYYGGASTQFCNLAINRVSAAYGGKKVWLSEYSVWPNGGVLSNSVTDGRSAMMAADWLQYLTVNANVAGGCWHALSGGVWDLFRKDATTGAPIPTACYWSLLVARSSLQNDLITTVSGNTANQHLIATQTTDGKKIGIMALNDTDQTVILRITLPNVDPSGYSVWTQRRVTGLVAGVDGPAVGMVATNYRIADLLVTDGVSVGFALAPRSVYSFAQ